MAQHDYVISNDNGANVRADINNVLQAILTSNSGSSQPSTTQAGMFWGDTSNASTYYLKMRNHTNDAWVSVYAYDVSSKTIHAVSVATTSTDNAIVRFDGPTGQVQNSGVIIDDSGNVGIGVTPSTWYSGSKAIDFNAGGIATYGNTSTMYLLSNSYNNTNDNWSYKNSGAGAALYSMNSGIHSWHTAPSGTAGNAIPWTTAMTLGSNGNLLVGTTTDNGVDKLQVNGSIIAGRNRIITGSFSNIQGNQTVDFTSIGDGGGTITVISVQGGVGKTTWIVPFVRYGGIMVIGTPSKAIISSDPIGSITASGANIVINATYANTYLYYTVNITLY